MHSLLLLLLTVSAEPDEGIRFVETTERRGLVEPLAGIMGHGGAWGDFDGDGRIDLFVGGFCDRPADQYAPADGPVPTKLFHNTPQGFRPVEQPELSFYSRTSGAVFADLDNNGTLELYVANNAKPTTNLPEGPRLLARNRFSNLFRNDGGRLVEISASSGACPESLRTARNVGVFDYDGDGLLDLLVLEDMFTRGPRSLLLHNRGGLRFEVANAEAGIPDDLFGLGLAVGDVNEDGRPDVFVGHSNRFFLSTGDGKFREDAALNKTFAWEPLDREDWPCGAALADLNRDGRLDLVLSIHHERARNKVYLNEGLQGGVPRYRDVTAEVGLAEVIPQKCPHVEVQDFDNDGWPDIYFSAAWLDDDGTVTPLVYRHQGLKDGVPRFRPPRKIGTPMVYYPAGPSGDYDGDGRVDLFLINWFQGNRCRLMHNESAENHWLQVRVTSKQKNRMGIGAQVRVYAAGGLGKPGALLGFQEVATGYGYASGQPAVCHFGLGQHVRCELEMRMPGGETVRLTDVAADRVLRIE